jgi:hypothetical protein
MSQQETAPLLGGSNGNNNGGTYYFNNKTSSDVKESAGKYESVSDTDGGQVVESLPRGASAQDFEPRMIGSGSKVSIEYMGVNTCLRPFAPALSHFHFLF